MKEGVTYKKQLLKITRVQSTDLGKYEATASFNDDRYINSVQLELANAGSSVVSSGVLLIASSYPVISQPPLS